MKKIMEFTSGDLVYTRGVVPAIKTDRYLTLEFNIHSSEERPDDPEAVELPRNLWNDPPLVLKNAISITTEKTGKIYPPVGRCIYCPSTEEPLTTEHFVPEGLGAALQLPRASCETCRLNTGKFEGSVLRTMLHASRRRLKIRGKNRKREDKFQITQLVNGERITYDLPIQQHPSILLFPIYRPPNLISWPSITNRSHIASMSGYSFYCEGIEAPTRFETKIDTLKFCQMLAKIAHGFAVAEYGINGFEPFLTSTLRHHFKPHERWGDMADYVGGDPQFYAPSKDLHALGHHIVKFGNERFLVVSIRLFALLAAPVYRIVVGKV